MSEFRKYRRELIYNAANGRMNLTTEKLRPCRRRRSPVFLSGEKTFDFSNVSRVLMVADGVFSRAPFRADKPNKNATISPDSFCRAAPRNVYALTCRPYQLFATRRLRAYIITRTRRTRLAFTSVYSISHHPCTTFASTVQKRALARTPVHVIYI